MRTGSQAFAHLGGSIQLWQAVVILGWCAAFVWGVARILAHGLGGNQGGEDFRRGGDWPGGPRPDPPRPGGPDLDPDWWPEFERQLVGYIDDSRTPDVEVAPSSDKVSGSTSTATSWLSGGGAVSGGRDAVESRDWSGALNPARILIFDQPASSASVGVGPKDVRYNRRAARVALERPKAA
jgi:hypothetical protein